MFKMIQLIQLGGLSMQSFSEYFMHYISTLYFPNEEEINQKIDALLKNSNEPYIQLIKYRYLENYYSCFYKDQLSAEIKDLVKNIWLRKREIFKNASTTSIINNLNDHKSNYNRILFRLYKKKHGLYKELDNKHIQKQLFKQLFYVSLQIIYYSQLKICIDQLFHKFAAILYI